MDNSDNLNGKTAVVTGASGYIGSVLVDALIEKSCKVIRISRRELKPLADTKTIKADIRSPDIWDEIIAKADIVYHLAGNTSTYEAAVNPAESLNSTLLPLNHLINAAQKQQRKPLVIFASTATVYGLTQKHPIDETFEPLPITTYDLHKFFAEQQLTFATQRGLLNCVSLRLANVYGPSKSLSSASDRGILNKVTASAFQGENLIVYGDGNYLRDYVYIDDVVRAFIFAGTKKITGSIILNVSTGKSISVSDAFKIVAERTFIATGNRVDIMYLPWPAGVSEIEFRNYISDNSNILLKLGWLPTIALETGIDCMLVKMKDNFSSYRSL